MPMEKKKNDAKSALKGRIISSMRRACGVAAATEPAKNEPTEKPRPMAAHR